MGDDDNKIARELGENAIRLQNLESRIGSLETKLWLALIGLISVIGKAGLDFLTVFLRGLAR